MKRLLSTLFAIALLAVASAAQAQMMSMGGGGGSHRMVTFGVGAGAAVPVNDAKDVLKNGYNGMAYARVQVPGMPLSFGVNVLFQKFDYKTAQVATFTGYPPTGGNTSVLAGVGDVKLDLMKGPITPYIVAGLGAYSVKAETETAGGSSSQTDTRFGINGGAGLSARISMLRLFVQGRVDNVYTSDSGFINTNSIQVIPVTVGLEY